MQPLIARYILPWYGGSPAVWTTCLLFFQVLLLAGYGYAHWITEKLSWRVQSALHGSLLVLSLAMLPIVPDAGWKPSGPQLPTLRILLLLTATIGIPYALLSTTGPLLQRWYSRSRPARSPYRLYALSNTGSLLALISYPLLFEPNLTLRTQAISWSTGYVVFVTLCGWCAWRAAASRADETVTAQARHDPTDDAAAQRATTPSPSRADVATWLALAAFPSIMLLATTNHLCQEVAVVPFLWIVPLSLYLLSFIICFDNERWYNRKLFGGMLLVTGLLAAYLLFHRAGMPLPVQIVVFSSALFACCMTCHGELARSKPRPRHLTAFYLSVASGGALGGVFVALVAPYLFKRYWELHLGLAGCVVLTLIAYLRSPDRPRPEKRSRWAQPLFVRIGVVLVLALGLGATLDSTHLVDRQRSFYGVLTVEAGQDELGEYYSLRHGRIEHGLQYLDEDKKTRPTSYYGDDSGVGLALHRHPRRADAADSSLRVGVVGLGTGTIAAHGRAGDQFRFYEIDPVVIRVAERYFSFSGDSPAEVALVLGDARLSLERELAQDGSRRFHVLAVDAFSGDAVPMHLLTRECYDLYWSHLETDGILAIHVSNRYVDLTPIVHTLAADSGHAAVLIDWANDDEEFGLTDNSWVLVARDAEVLGTSGIESDPWPQDPPPRIVWTDDYSSLLQVLM